MAMEKICNFIIRWSFYALFFFVPLVFSSQTSELFEYNKMMLTYGLTIIIATAWICKSLVIGHWSLKIGNWSIGLLLYLATHVVSTFISIDPHTSIWGYYSRFHEGLLATISYIILYFAAVNNLEKNDIYGIIYSSFASGVIVSLWGISEHFGVSPSCVIFTGQADVSCWIQDVKNRVFATLGQPNWMAAYLDVLILLSLGMVVSKITNEIEERRKNEDTKIWLYSLLSVLFFTALLFTKSRSGILGLIAGLSVFGLILLVKNGKNILFNRILILSSFFFLLSSMVFGLPFSQIENYSLEKIFSPKALTANPSPLAANSGYIDIGISESGDIRKIVWEGAVKVWQRYPIFGSGVETFAFAYYKDRPAAHNMVSEWDFLYNKAHNEYLNLLATTGTVGIISYLILILTFIIFNFKFQILKGVQNQKIILGLVSGYITILVTNFFGFSVVIIGLYFFLIPAFCDILASQSSGLKAKSLPTTIWSWAGIGVTFFIAFTMLLNLLNMYTADVAYALGQNYNKVNHFTGAYKKLSEAVELNPEEPVFLDELAYSASILFPAAKNQNEATLASQLAEQAIALSDKALFVSPNNLTFYKTRTKISLQLQDTQAAKKSLEKAIELAPTDAKIHYNYGLVLQDLNLNDQAISVLTETTKLKPNYSEAFFALANSYKAAGQMDLARQQVEYILKYIGDDPNAKKWLDDNKIQ